MGVNSRASASTEAQRRHQDGTAKAALSAPSQTSGSEQQLDYGKDSPRANGQRGDGRSDFATGGKWAVPPRAGGAGATAVYSNEAMIRPMRGRAGSIEQRDPEGRPPKQHVNAGRREKDNVYGNVDMSFGWPQQDNPLGKRLDPVYGNQSNVLAVGNGGHSLRAQPPEAVYSIAEDSFAISSKGLPKRAPQAEQLHYGPYPRQQNTLEQSISSGGRQPALIPSKRPGANASSEHPIGMHRQGPSWGSGIYGDDDTPEYTPPKQRGEFLYGNLDV